ncbi:hypothetical protein KO465_04745 [Candidatus Micrarchaeota archaeon]|nr:hypothetical protein [Candidatus Micrarchaeota archaeon]
MANQVANTILGMILKGQVAGLSDTFKVILMKDGFTFDPDEDNCYADIIADEINSGLGYTTGGETLTGATVVVDDASDKAYLYWNYAEWIPTGGSISACAAVVYDDSTATGSGDDYTDAIVLVIDFGGTVTAPDGQRLRVNNIKITLN